MKSRGNWTSWFEFFFSCLGHMVGLGNIWRFPYICYKNGGGAFVIVYALLIIIIVLPIIFVELSIAQFSNKATVQIWQCCPLFQGVGYAMMVYIFFICIYYNIIVSWTLYYWAMSFSSVLPWTTCDNEWNTPACFSRSIVDRKGNLSVAIQWNDTSLQSSIGTENCTFDGRLKRGREKNESCYGIMPKPPTEEFWERRALQITSGVHDLGGLQWHLTLCLLVAWILVFLALVKGIRSSGKVMYFLATFPYLLLLVLFIRGMTLPGSADGMRYFIVPEWERLLDISVWSDAANQAFFSAGVGGGVILTIASYNKFHNNCYRDAIILPIADGLTSLFAGLVIFTTLGYMAHILEVDIKNVVKQGPGIAFMVYPEALSTLPIPNLWSVIFFLMLISVGLDTQIVQVQSVMTNFLDHYPHLRSKQTSITLVFCLVCFLLGIIFTSHGGVYIVHLLDYYLPALCGMLLGILEITVISWIYGTTRLLDDIELMLGYKPNKIWRIFWLFICPICSTVIWGLNVSRITPVTYGKTSYPQWALGIGWVAASISLVVIPMGMCQPFYQQTGTLIQRIKASMKPSKSWIPVVQETDEEERMRFNMQRSTINVA